jgi:hypothetical protein
MIVSAFVLIAMLAGGLFLMTRGRQKFDDTTYAWGVGLTGLAVAMPVAVAFGDAFTGGLIIGGTVVAWVAWVARGRARNARWKSWPKGCAPSQGSGRRAGCRFRFMTPNYSRPRECERLWVQRDELER